MSEFLVEQNERVPDTVQFLRQPKEVERIFAQLLEQWSHDTRVTSDQVAVLMHPAHLRIIGLGPQVLPCISKNLSEGGGPWFVALEAIVGENPFASTSSKANQMRNDWLAWGREHGYLGA